jgi:hypothetical protein
VTADDFSLPLGQGRLPKQRPLPVLGRRPMAILTVVVAIIGAGSLIAHEWLRPADGFWGAIDSSGGILRGGPMMLPLADFSPNFSPDPMQRDDAAVVPVALHATAQPQSADDHALTTPVGQTITIVNGLTGTRQDLVVPVAAPEDHSNSDRDSTEMTGRDRRPKSDGRIARGEAHDRRAKDLAGSPRRLSPPATPGVVRP